MMYDSQPTGITQNSNGSMFFFTPALSGSDDIVAGTSTLNIYVSNTSASDRSLQVRLRVRPVGPTLFQDNTLVVPANTMTPMLFSLPYATSAHDVQNNDYLELGIQVQSPADLHWDGTYNDSGVEVPMSVALAAVGSSSTDETTGTQLTISHTTSGINRLMLVGVSFGLVSSESVDTITYNGVDLTREDFRNSPGNQARVEIWSLVAPDTGTHDVVVDFTAAAGDGAMVGVMTFEGVNQADALRTMATSAGSGGNSSVSIGSGPGELVFAVVAVDDSTDYDLQPGGSQNEEWDMKLSEGNGGGSTQSGASPTVDATWTWTGSDNWASGGISVKPN